MIMTTTYVSSQGATLDWHVGDDIGHKVVPQHCQGPRSAEPHRSEDCGGSPRLAGIPRGGGFRIPWGG